MADADHMRRFWDARARENANYFVDNRVNYAGGDEAWFWEQGERDLRQMLELLQIIPTADDTVLDVGCGVGRLLKALAPQVAATIGIDVSEEMVARARENLAGLPVTLQHGDGTTLAPVADASVEGVVSLVVFQHIPDPRVTLGYIREIGRVLKPGGWAGIHVSDDPAIHAADYKMPSRLKRLLGRAPQGQDDPAWRGSAVTLDGVRAAAGDGGCDVELVVNAGTQFCLVRLRRRRS
jgi:SAM-dependent methyltransferase